MLQTYIEYWRDLDVTRPPYVHPADKYLILADPRFAVLKDGQRESDFKKAPGNKQLHLDLLPAPHSGDLRNAKIFVVELNPGYGPENYVEQQSPQFRDKLIAQIHQQVSAEDYPLLTLDPANKGTGGYQHWNDGWKFGGLIKRLAATRFQRSADPMAEARRLLARHTVTLEIMPYISKEYDSRCDHLRSFEIAQQLLHEYLKPKAYNNELLVIVTRKLKRLGLKTEEQSLDFVLYNPRSEARRAPLTPNSRGGQAILRWCERVS